ncbi:MAG: right-handed parallel beta-helix repeat-containing protein [bacterium]
MNSKTKNHFAIFLIFLFSIRLSAQIYVSPSGEDSNNGSINNPYKTFQKAVSIVTAGITIYLRDGTFEISETIRLITDGTSDNKINLFAYENEKPVLDFSSQSYSTSSRGIQLEGDYWYLKGLEVCNAGDNGIHISGGFNIVENCVLHGNKDTGLQISNGGHDNLIRNCDSYLNYDSGTNGENADGFAPKLDVGPGNVFRGCRAYYNSDDGWDCYEAAYQIIIDSCWSFQNGVNRWNDSNFQGDGNGFKVGGNYVPAPVVVTRCMAFDNPSKGFDQNHNTNGVTLYNNTAFRNGKNFSFTEDPTTGQHILKNNISLSGTVSITNSALEETNSWQGNDAGGSDFLSLDTSLARAERKIDGSLPENNFLRLAEGSSLIDAGVDVGLAFEGIAPDLGAFEYPAPVGIENNISLLPDEFELYQNYPNPFNPTTVISYTIPAVETPYMASVRIYDVLGNEITVLLNSYQSPGKYEIQFDGESLPSGIYFYQLRVGDFIQTKKMVLLQ